MPSRSKSSLLRVEWVRNLDLWASHAQRSPARRILLHFACVVIRCVSPGSPSLALAKRGFPLVESNVIPTRCSSPIPSRRNECHAVLCVEACRNRKPPHSTPFRLQAPSMRYSPDYLLPLPACGSLFRFLSATNASVLRRSPPPSSSSPPSPS